MFPLITLEEHFLLEVAVENEREGGPYKSFPGLPTSKLYSLDTVRLQDMDKGQIAMQVISHGPLKDEPSINICQQANDLLAEAVKRHPKRFAAFSMIPMSQPKEAAAELERSIKDLGFVGTMVPNHVNGAFYDHADFWPVFEMAEKLDVPIYLHPTWASDESVQSYSGNYSKGAAASIAHWGWGWHSETGIHVLRLFACGLFDRYPKLKIIIGHDGEMLPFMFDRLQRATPRWGPRQRNFQEVWDNNFWVTTSGMFSLPPFACLLETTKVDRIMFSIDYPYEPIEDGMPFMEKVKDSGLVSEEELKMIAYGTAEKLLGISVS